MSSLWARVLAVLAAIGAILVAVLRIFSKGQKAGANEVTVKAQEKEIKDVQTANKVDSEVARAKPGAAQSELRNDWSRD